jgi:NAD(P)-dependent dehydrogenase (short-subunit alcohol dehydrogenase family)
LKVQNKVILVTGGGSGMGRELVLNLLSKGAKLLRWISMLPVNRKRLHFREIIKMQLAHF